MRPPGRSSGHTYFARGQGRAGHFRLSFNVRPFNVRQANRYRALAKYSGKKSVSQATREEGLNLAQATQRPGQTKEQTRLIAQGIQRGIDMYKKQHKARARELDRKLRQAQSKPDHHAASPPSPVEDDAAHQPATGSPSAHSRLPWLLLALTWAGIGAYVALPSLRELLTG